MDTVRFAIEDYIDLDNGYQFPTINIYINEHNLIHLVEQIERPYFPSTDTGQLYRQSYVGLHPGYYRHFRDEFLGQTKRPLSVLLTCTCWEALCNSIVARVVIDPQTVTWSELRSPFLGVASDKGTMDKYGEVVDGPPIDYSSLGPFVFQRKQYMDALNTLEWRG